MSSSKYIPIDQKSVANRAALDRQRSYWESILVMVMHKLQVKEVIITDEDLRSLSTSCPPGEKAYLITFPGNDALNQRFRLLLAYGEEERTKILAENEKRT